MSVDLRIHLGDPMLSQIWLQQDCDLFEKLKEKAFPFEEDLCIGDESVDVDSIGEPLTYVRAGEVFDFLPRGERTWNGYVWALIRALPANHKIVLFWR